VTRREVESHIFRRIKGGRGQIEVKAADLSGFEMPVTRSDPSAEEVTVISVTPPVVVIPPREVRPPLADTSLEALNPSALRFRRRRIILYFTRVAIHFLWWDMVLKWGPLSVFRTSWIPRWQRLTRDYKELALELQGLWVKLGQFLSTRVDVLPLQITSELESLRDEVPPVSGAIIIAQIEADLSRPLVEVFSAISPLPIGSASLAQVHRAQTVAGDPVVVKVLRPAIRQIIRDDMKLLRQVGRRFKSLKIIAERADLNSIIDEFDLVTTRELDLRLEAHNAGLFAEDFAADPAVATPRIDHDRSSANILTMEDVSYIRIDDVEKLQRVGIDPKAVARKIYDIYLTQFFVTYRVHADPHPGNLFVRPLPSLLERGGHPIDWGGFKPGEAVGYAPARQFQLVVVDFGMFVEMPPRLREGLRDFAIGLGTRDARQILNSYSKLGVLQGNPELDRIEEMIQAQLDGFWGTFIGQMRESDLTGPAAHAFLNKYKGLMAAAPFQFRTEMLFMTRAMGILSGLTYKLDPEFDAWNETAPFAQRLIREDIGKAVRRSVSDLVAGRPPSNLTSLLRFLPTTPRARAQTVVVDTANLEEVRRLRKSVNRLTTLVVAGGLVAIGAALEAKGVKVSHLVWLPWPKTNLVQWLIEMGGLMLIIVFLKRDS
jgi:predicted unusual protein kinase regulating ubiquinone biosynthesis (AarF/ABC1/UbiB family)